MKDVRGGLECSTIYCIKKMQSDIVDTNFTQY